MQGGAIYAENGVTITISDTKFERNTADSFVSDLSLDVLGAFSTATSAPTAMTDVALNPGDRSCFSGDYLHFCKVVHYIHFDYHATCCIRSR